MGTRERYDHGVFSSVELATSDAQAARAFYERLFGWDVGDDGIARKDGHGVAVLREGKRPPGWLGHVTVDDLDAAAGRVQELGGTVLEPPRDVGSEGRMAVVQDPQGARIALWQANEVIGAELVNSPGALSWNDLQTTDVDGAVAFYTELLGWEVGEVEGAPDERKVIRVGEGMNGGIARLAEQAAEQGVPPHWLAIFAVDDVDAAVRTARDAGGEAIVEGLDIPAGRMAVLSDPQRVMFAVFSGDLDP